MPSRNQRISLRQLQLLLILDTFGSGVLLLPRRAAEAAGQDGWLCVLLAVAAALICGWLVTSLGRLYPGEHFTAYTARIITKPAAILLSALLLAKILLSAGLELRLFGELTRQVLLPRTPFWAVTVTLLLVSAYAAAKGYETRGRMAEILFLPLFVPFLIILLLGVRDTDFSNLLPAFTANPGTISRGTLGLGYAFGGLEFLLLVHPYINRPKDVRRRSLTAILITGGLMLLVTVMAIARFGPAGLVKQTWPVLELMEFVSVPGAFWERQTALVFTFWILSSFFIVNAGLFFSALLLTDMNGKGPHHLYVVLCAAVIFAVSLLPSGLPQVYDLLDLLYRTLGIGFLLAVPLLLLTIARLRKLGKRYE